jgi:TraB/PrgY/gumN family
VIAIERRLLRTGYTLMLTVATLALVVPCAFATSNGGVPAFKITASNGAASIIVGSAHVGVYGMREPDATIFAGARQFVVEHRGDVQPGDSGDVVGATRAAWAQDLTGTQIAVYLHRADCAGVAPAVALSLLMRPSVQWANQLAYSVCGWGKVPSRDAVLDSEKPQGLKTEYLEDDAWVEAKRRSVPPYLSDTSFKWALAHEPEQVWNRIRDAVNEGDYEGIRDQFDASVGSAENAKQLDRIMVDERNATWMPRLRTYLDEGDAVIVVGAMHLPGDNGLIQKLRSSGYKVDAITIPAKAD